MATDYTLFAIPAGETETEILLIGPLASKAHLAPYIARAKAEGFHSLRIATFDGSPPDFARAARLKRGLSRVQINSATRILNRSAK